VCYSKRMEENNQGEEPQQEAKKQVPRPQSSIVPDHPASSNAQSIGDQSQKNDIQELEDPTGKAQIWMNIRLTGAIAVFAFCSVVVGTFQWSTMRGQLDQMISTSGQTERLVILYGGQLAQSRRLAEAAKAQSEQTTEQAKATNRLAIAAKRSADAQERAWVGTSGSMHVSVGTIDDKNIIGTVNVPMTNFGKTPASHVWSHVYFVTGGIQDTFATACDVIAPIVQMKPSRPTPKQISVDPARLGQVLFPGQTFVHPVKTSARGEDGRGKLIYIVGCIVYKDSLGPHWTKFCYQATKILNDPGEFETPVGCPVGNEAGDGQPEEPN